MPQIRLAEQEDCANIEAIANEAYTLYLERMDKKPFPMLDDYKAHIAAKHVYVLEDEEQKNSIVGYVVLLPEEDKTLLLDNIGVRPRFQKKGYGKKLMQFAEEWAREYGYRSIILYTNTVMYENLVWYPARGYAETHRVQEKGYGRVYFKKEI